MVDDRPKAAEFLQHERFFLLENTCCDPAATPTNAALRYTWQWLNLDSNERNE